ncbi:lactate permease LctP family transporter [Thermoflavimicrobium dichotomicum]|uniref:L-lactate permease n=1 Tax=Thermoflavimicrobium dichotomicum TaxID=46223 RepID=A0A1I3RU01_9BACL|nr:lactate permease LctP family transporter [Thermoflavimicrobium dichotomicum]SFJ49510.1 L-lactate permease/lactate permease [Thermoflavimicrobium dichotomicum]
MHTWTQIYEPLGNLGLSALVALIPILFYFLALSVFRWKGHTAGMITVFLSLMVAIFIYKMPGKMAVAATLYGFAYGIWPIAWIIVSAVFLYKITVKTGQFDIIRASVVSITEDQRLQMLLIAFSFGAFLEGAAGYGAPVAITASLLVGLGFQPLYAAGLCLIANTAPVAFGALGIPITVAGQVTGLDAFEIGQIAGCQLPFLSLFVPFWLVFIMDGKRGIRETWPAILVAGGSFSLTQFITANFIGPELPDITSSIVSLISLALFLKVWKPKHIFRFQERSIKEKSSYTLRQIVKAWTPFLILTVMVTIWTLKPVKKWLDHTTILLKVPGLDKLILKTEPIVNKVTPYAAEFKLDLIGATGTAIFLAAMISAIFLRFHIRSFFKTFAETVSELRWPIFTIGTVLAFAFIANYSGQSSTLGLALAGTGALFPFFSPFVGWLGVFLTGSDTSSNALFSNLQQVTAKQIGVNESLLVAVNSTGGVTGKMISPQSISVSCAAVGLTGHESDLFRFTLKHSLFFVIIIGIISYLQAYLVPWMLP